MLLGSIFQGESNCGYYSGNRLTISGSQIYYILSGSIFQGESNDSYNISDRLTFGNSWNVMYHQNLLFKQNLIVVTIKIIN